MSQPLWLESSSNNLFDSFHDVGQVFLGILGRLILWVPSDELFDRLLHDSLDNTSRGSLWHTSQDLSNESSDILRFHVSRSVILRFLERHVIEHSFDSLDRLLLDDSDRSWLRSSHVSKDELDDEGEVHVWSVAWLLGVPRDILLNDSCDGGLNRSWRLPWSSLEVFSNFLNDFFNIIWHHTSRGVLSGFDHVVRLDDFNDGLRSSWSRTVEPRILWLFGDLSDLLNDVWNIVLGISGSSRVPSSVLLHLSLHNSYELGSPWPLWKRSKDSTHETSNVSRRHSSWRVFFWFFIEEAVQDVPWEWSWSRLWARWLHLRSWSWAGL